MCSTAGCWKQGCSTLSVTSRKDATLGLATRARKPSAHIGVCPVTGPFAFFAVENLADRRGG
jgi:hypothetical protein